VFTVLQRTAIIRFPLFILIGWLVWGFTTSSITEGIGSIVANSNLIKKIYFPREVLPASAFAILVGGYLVFVRLSRRFGEEL
jgi:homopolymeric O-antigen transport system permease protein